jgi:phosphate transport system substrate-binding protein
MITPARSLLSLSIALLVAASCGGGEKTDTGGSASAPSETVIRVDGSSTVFPITEAVAEEFQKQRQGARVTVGISGTGGGFQKFCRAETDISDASRPIRSTEIEACKTAGIEFLELAVAYDGLAIVVNPKNTWTQSVTVEELKKLWEPAAERKVMQWSQVRNGWPDREVHLFGPGVDSGTFDYFTEAVVGKEDQSRGDFTSSEDDNVLVQGIAGDELALGYFGFAYYEENKDKLKLVPVDDGNPDNGKGPIAPSIETVRGGTYRPLSRPLFIYVNTKALGRPEVKAFVDYYFDKGTALVEEVGYVALAPRELELVRDRYKAGTTGTIYTDAKPGQTLESLLAPAQR